MNKVSLSIMIPTYNSANYLRDAITSVLAQDYSDYELIVVDNASSDNTSEVVAGFNDSRIKYFRNDKNLGSRGNINKCMELAAGEYLHHLCADDVLLPGVLKKQVDVLQRNPRVGLVTCDMYVTDENLENRRRANFYPGSESGKRVIRACCMNFANWIGGPSNVMFRREASVGLRYDERLLWVSDLNFFCDILENWDFCNIDEPGYLYRRHSGSDTETLSKLGIQKREELEFCKLRTGYNLYHLRYLKHKIGILNKIKLLSHFAVSFDKFKIVKFLHSILVGKNFRALLLSDYTGAAISMNVVYSNKNGIVNIGSGTSINDFTVIRIESGPGADLETSSLIIGQNTYIGELNNIRAAGGVIRIGDNVLISQMVTIVASNHGTSPDAAIMCQPWIRNKVVIEDDVWIGAGSVILPGTHICRGAIIAANSVVKGVVEPNSIMAGSPARKVKERS